MRNVLVVSYYYPPSGGPGVQRVLKFTRYLPRHGYRPLVLTVPESAAFPVRDPSLLAEIPPEAKVFRSSIREFYGAYRAATGGSSNAPVNLTTAARPNARFRERILTSLRGAVFIPDGRMAWVGSGTRAGESICEREGASLVFASGPPFTAHWIGRRIAERTGLPLVLDFRDPWYGAPFYPRRPRWARRLDERLERSCVRRAAAIVSVNREIRDDLLRRHPDLDPARMHVVSNGFDPADFEGLARRRDDAVWMLAHAGTLPSRGLPNGWVDAVRAWIRDEPEMERSMRLRLAGNVDPALLPTLSAPPLDTITRVEGYLSHAESVQLLVDSDLLLLLIEDGPRAAGILTGKLFEYLASGTPILALAPEGEAAEVVRRARAGRVIRGDDAPAIGEALREAFHAHRSGERPFGKPDTAYIAQFARPALTERLAGIFDAVGGSR